MKSLILNTEEIQQLQSGATCFVVPVKAHPSHAPWSPNGYPIIKIKNDGRFISEMWPKCERMMQNYGRCEELIPPYQIGQTVYIREPFRKYMDSDNLEVGWIKEYLAKGGHEILYLHDADGFQVFNKDGSERMINFRLCSREDSRYSITIEGVSCKRAHDLTQDECARMGLPIIAGKIDDSPVFRNWDLPYGHPEEDGYGMPCNAFASWYRHRYGKASWDTNPWLWLFTHQLLKV